VLVDLSSGVSLQEARSSSILLQKTSNVCESAEIFGLRHAAFGKVKIHLEKAGLSASATRKLTKSRKSQRRTGTQQYIPT
jgi:hypothetical protein